MALPSGSPAFLALWRTSDRRILGTLAAAWLIGITLLTPATSSAQDRPEPYTLGQGLRLGGSPIRLGGYIALEWEKPSREPAVFVFDDLSLFVFGDLGPRGRFFVEVEDSKFWRLTRRNSRVDHHLDLERLYVDYLHGDALKLRGGKFLTPVGTWNEIHPDPLTWTVSRPLASYAMFPTFVTGAQASGTIARDTHDVDYNLFAQVNPCLDCNTGERQTERLAGGRVRWRWHAVEIGIPALRYVDRRTADSVTFSGADLIARKNRIEVRGEATAGRVHRAAHADSKPEYAWYLQGLYALTDRHFLVTRAERARSRDADVWSAWSIGGLYRPKPAMSLKLEFQHRAGRFPVDEGTPGRRVLASLGVLF